MDREYREKKSLNRNFVRTLNEGDSLSEGQEGATAKI